MKKSNILFLVVITLLIGVIIGQGFANFNTTVTADDLSLDDQEATIRAIKKVMPAVVSIKVFDTEQILYIDDESENQQIKNERIQQGNGTGFLISSDGLILTNKHVVTAAQVDTGEFKVILNTGKEYFAQLIGLDPLKDIAILKIFDKDLPYIEMGDSNSLEIGSTVIAIGNALGKYQNSATKGIVSGLGRYIFASNEMNSEKFDNVIQTDAEINLGNSGGPLIDLSGKVIGVNSAVDNGGTAIGFAIPMIDVEPVIRTVKQSGRIIRPRLGVYYMTITPYLAEKHDLPIDRGAWIHSDTDAVATVVLPYSPASRGGLEPEDIVFEVNAIPINEKNTLFSVIQKYKPGDKIGLKIQRGEKVIIRVVEIEEFKL